MIAMKRLMLFVALLVLLALFLFIFAPGTLSAVGFRSHFIQLTTDVSNLDIGVQVDRFVPAVGLANHSDKLVRCSATFSNGPQFEERRSTTIAPGKRATLVYPVHFIAPVIHINVKCTEVTGG
jgi:hypothetical protein